MIKFKDIFSDNKRLISSALIHSGLMWVSLAFAYNSYKEYVRGYNNINIFPTELKVAIKSTFPWAIIFFVALFILFSIVVKKWGSYSSFRQYVGIFFCQAIIVNLLFFSNGYHVLIVQNLALFYLTIFILIWSGVRMLIIIDVTDWIKKDHPWIAYKSLHENMPRIREYCKKRPSVPYIGSFVVLFILCSFLIVFKAQKVAELLANVAYLLLIIGVVIEIYKSIKYAEKDDKSEEHP